MNVELIEGIEEENYLNKVKEYQNKLRKHHVDSKNHKNSSRKGSTFSRGNYPGVDDKMNNE